VTKDASNDGHFEIGHRADMYNSTQKLEAQATHWDLYHWRPWVNEEMNNVWLNQLCNE